MEFDYVPFDQLSVLASQIREAVGPDSFSAPPADDDAFWAKCATACGLSPHEGQDLAESVLSDFSSREFHLLSEQPSSVWLGDLCSTESRLAIAALGIKGICTVASHSIDELWADDGIAYKTAIVSPSLPIGEHLEACVEFLERHTPAVICCSSGIGASAVIAAAFLIHSQRSLDATSALTAVRDAAVGGGRLDVSEEDHETLQIFCDARETRTPSAAKPQMAVSLSAAEEKELRLCPLLPSPLVGKNSAEKMTRLEGEATSAKRARRGICMDLDDE